MTPIGTQIHRRAWGWIALVFAMALGLGGLGGSRSLAALLIANAAQGSDEGESFDEAFESEADLDALTAAVSRGSAAFRHTSVARNRRSASATVAFYGIAPSRGHRPMAPSRLVRRTPPEEEAA